MKLIITALLVVLLIPAILFGAEANVKSSFTVKAPYQKTIDFINNNPKKMRDAAGIEVLQDLGNGKLKVKRETLKGDFTWIMQEDVEEKNSVYIYNSKFVESIEGGIEDSYTNIIVKANRNYVTVDINIKVVINNGKVTNFDLFFDLKRQIRKIEKLLQLHLEKDWDISNKEFSPNGDL